jgi:DNA-nicking Smr family endonuclease
MTRKLPDHELWTETVKSVKPLRRRGTKKTAWAATTDMQKPTLKISMPHLHVPRATAKAPPPITGFDRRTTQKLTRGNVEIESRLDLHGTGSRWRGSDCAVPAPGQCGGLAHRSGHHRQGRLPHARHTLHGSDHFHAPERQGRLRRMLPEWLHEAEFRALVSGFQPAHPKHGGGGAFYVKMRRMRERP